MTCVVVWVRLGEQTLSDIYLFPLQPLVYLWKDRGTLYNHLKTTTTFLLIHMKQQILYLCSVFIMKLELHLTMCLERMEFALILLQFQIKELR